MDFAAIDCLGRPIENPTIQMDLESGERFGITYLTKKSMKIILYYCIAAPLEVLNGLSVVCLKSALDMKEKAPCCLCGLHPLKSVIPIAERHLEYVAKLAQELRDAHTGGCR